MFPPRKTLILIISLYLLSFNCKSQLLSDTTANLINSDQNYIGNDSINNKRHSSDFINGRADAKEFYDDKTAFAVSFLTSLIVPPIGFITTIAVSTTRPKIKNLNIPDDQLLRNDQYMMGYIQKASRMKAGRAWIGCLTGVTFLCLGVIMIYQ